MPANTIAASASALMSRAGAARSATVSVSRCRLTSGPPAALPPRARARARRPRGMLGPAGALAVQPHPDRRRPAHEREADPDRDEVGRRRLQEQLPEQTTGAQRQHGELPDQRYAQLHACRYLRSKATDTE